MNLSDILHAARQLRRAMDTLTGDDEDALICIGAEVKMTDLVRTLEIGTANREALAMKARLDAEREARFDNEIESLAKAIAASRQLSRPTSDQWIGCCDAARAQLASNADRASRLTAPCTTP